jgi:hypothetical protein
MLAVPIDLGKCGTCALRAEPRGRNLQLDRVRLGLGPADRTASGDFLHLHVGNSLATNIIITTKEGACAQQPP